MKKTTIKKIVFIGLLAVVFLLITFSFTHAQTNPIASIAANSAISFISWTLGTILFVVGYFFHLVLYLGGVILNWVLELNSNIVDNPAVQIGWPITRDIANLAFVFLIIVIAFDTILRMGSLQIKNALPKLIIAALLINFSLLIATVFLDFAGVFTNFFLNSAYSASGNGGISQALAGAMNMYSFLKTPTFDANVTLTTFGAGTVQFLSSLIFADIMTMIGAITMLGLAVMFLIRYVVIGVLLITLPAAIIAWVVGGSGWSTWTDKFFKQTFFGPIAAFFIYIALKSQTAIEGIVNSSSITKAVADDPSHVIQGTATNIGSMIMVVAILLYGIKKAEDGSEFAGKLTTSTAMGAINGILKGTTSTVMSGTGAGWAARQVGKLGEMGKGSKSGIIRGITRPFRRVGTAEKEFKQTYGGITGLYTATTEEISGGLGWNSRKLRLKEEKEFEKKGKGEKETAEREVRVVKIALQELELNNLNSTLVKLNESFKMEMGKSVQDKNKINAIQKEIETVSAKIKTSTVEVAKAKAKEGGDLEKLKKEIEELKEKGGGEKEEKKEEKK